MRIEDYINLHTEWGLFKAVSLSDISSSHLMLIYGTISPHSAPLTRIHSSCCFGDVFRNQSCDCGAQLEESIKAIISEGSGIIFYLNQEGRGLGLASKIEAIRLEQSDNIDTVEAYSKLHFPLDARNYQVVVAALNKLGVDSIRLLTNNPVKLTALESSGIKVFRVPLITNINNFSVDYIKAKVNKMGHLWNNTLELQESEASKK